MNLTLLIALVLAGATIAFDHLIRELPQWLAIVLYTAAVILFILGMLRSRRTRN